MMTLETRVATLVIEALELEDYTPETFPADALLFGPEEAGGLELDSLSALEIVATLSDTFDHDFEKVERDDLMSVATIVDYIRRHGLGG